jgi:hypothetical protein
MKRKRGCRLSLADYDTARHLEEVLSRELPDAARVKLVYTSSAQRLSGFRYCPTSLRCKDGIPGACLTHGLDES